MQKTYDHQKIEKKWHQKWFKAKLFRASDEDKSKPKYYVLDMFPYPSSAGLHVGHPEGYTATDIISRYLRMKGYNVLHPMGWDAFGLPAENYAIKTKIHPEKSTLASITTFKRQIQELGFSYDWEREIATCLPEYYQWTQWFFCFLYKNGLAYKKKAPVNWCNDCQTVLANEQVVEGHCERCKFPVTPKFLAQWFFKITDFIDDTGETSGLLSGLDKIDWPESTKIGQRNWIGRSEGVNWINQRVKDMDISFEMYDSVPQTYMAQRFCVIAPEHPMVAKLVEGTEHEKPVTEFVEKVKKRKMENKFDLEKEKDGIFTGRVIDNPFGTGDLPIWVASFVVMDYGTGVVHSSAHDERDFAFAKANNLPLHPVMFPEDPEEAKKVEALEYCYHHDPMAIMQEPAEFKGRRWGEVREDLIDFVVKKGLAKRQTNYKMRDWLVSRQRYWGAPIPMVYDDQENEYLLPEDELPVHLPEDVDFNPKGESPLTQSKSFHDQKILARIEEKLKKSGSMPKDRKLVRRESDTMDTFVCSSWYMWRFMDPKNKKEFASKKLMEQWGPVDLYVGGAEHTVLHLLYARFFCKALHRHGYISTDEPFTKLRHQGMILGEDGEKMSKSRGNVINPDEIVKQYGADTLRMYEMFMGPFKDMKPWSTKGVLGAYRFLKKTWAIITEAKLTDEEPDHDTLKMCHQTLKKVTHDIEEFKFNTAISQMMIMINHIQKLGKVPKAAMEILLTCLYPFAPHMAEECWELMGHKAMIMNEPWPAYDEAIAKEEQMNMPIQIAGKLRGTITVPVDIGKEEALALALAEPNVAKYLQGNKIVKEIFVAGKIINLVVT